MFSQFTRAVYGYAQKTAGHSATWAGLARDTTKNYAGIARHAVLILGALALGLLALIFVKPEAAEQFRQLSPFAAAAPANPDVAQAPETSDALAAVAPAVAAAAAPEVRGSRMPAKSSGRPHHASASTATQQKWVAYWLAKRYRVAGDAIHMLVSTSYQVAKELKLDPLLILSVIAIESRFNPLSESPVGAQGLMQVMSNIHKDKFQKHGGVAAALNPVANINVGSRILKEYVVQGGSVEAGLKKYVGAAAFDTDFGYGRKVLAEYHYLQEVAMGKKVSANAKANAAPRTQPKMVKNDPPVELQPTARNDLPRNKNDPENSADQVASL